MTEMHNTREWAVLQTVDFSELEKFSVLIHHRHKVPQPSKLLTIRETLERKEYIGPLYFLLGFSVDLTLP